MPHKDDWTHPLYKDNPMDTADTDGTTLEDATLSPAVIGLKKAKASNVVQFGRPGKGAVGETWPDTVSMLTALIKEIESGETKADGALIIVYGNDREKNADLIKFWARGLTRMELLGLAADVFRSLP